jgi:ABC-type transport system involved in multi-copper enzyme maturation permease subunit
VKRFAALVRHSLHATLGGRRLAGVGALALAPLAVALAIRYGADAHPDTMDPVFLGIGAGLVVPLIALVIGVSVLREDLDRGAIVHLITRGVPRETVLAARLTAAAAATALAGAVALTLPLLVVGGEGFDAWRVGVPVAALAGAAYTGLFTLLGVSVRRAGLLGLGYLVVWETVVASSPLLFRFASVGYWARSLIQASDAVDPAVTGGSFAGDPASATASVIALVSILLVTGLIGAAWFARREFAGPEPET